MTTAQSNVMGTWTVSVDNQTPQVVDSFVNSENAFCGYVWSAFNLANTAHTVVVNVSQASSQAALDGVPPMAGYELDGIM